MDISGMDEIKLIKFIKVFVLFWNVENKKKMFLEIVYILKNMF